MTKAQHRRIYERAISILAASLTREEFDLIVTAIDEDPNAGFYWALRSAQNSMIVVDGKVTANSGTIAQSAEASTSKVE